MSNSIPKRASEYSHRGSIYVDIIGFTNRHLSLAERATIRRRPYPAVSPSPSSVGRGVYSVGDVMKGTASSSFPSCLGIEDGCGRRKKYARGIASGRTYFTVAVRKAQQQSDGFLPMTTPRPLVHQGFGAPTKGMHPRAQQHLFQTQNIWIRRKYSDPAHCGFSNSAYPTLRPAIVGV